MTGELLKIGSLARRSGISVRTLHHYDDIGLLCPSFKSAAGHRQYTAADALRLTHILALRSLGFELARIAELLAAPDASPIDSLLALQERVRKESLRTRLLEERLAQLLAALEEDRTPTLETLLETLESMNDFKEQIDRYYTPEQQAYLSKRAEELGPERMAQAPKDWAQLYADAKAAAEAGVDPHGEEGQALVARKRALIEAFTGGDPGILDSLRRMTGEDPSVRQAISGDAAAMEFLRRAEEGSR